MEQNTAFYTFDLPPEQPRHDHLQTVARDVGAILLSHGIPVRGWSGVQAAEIGCHRVSHDYDGWVPDSAIYPAFEYLRRYASYPVKMEDLEDRTIVTVGEGEVELMANMDIHTEDGIFPLRLTKRVLHSESPQHYYDGRWPFAFAPPEDTMLLKAILQRGEDVGKHDGVDIAAMANNLPWINEPYLRYRMEVTGAADRALPFLQAYGVLLDYTPPEYC